MMTVMFTVVKMTKTMMTLTATTLMTKMVGDATSVGKVVILLQKKTFALWLRKLLKRN